MYDRTIERGDTFIVDEVKLRGCHFTCTSKKEDLFYAGDTEGRMWKFDQTAPDEYRVSKSSGDVWRRKTTISPRMIHYE